MGSGASKNVLSSNTDVDKNDSNDLNIEFLVNCINIVHLSKEEENIQLALELSLLESQGSVDDFTNHEEESSLLSKEYVANMSNHPDDVHLYA